MRKVKRNLGLALVALSAALTAGAQQPIAEVQELEEIWVRGKHLSELIVDKEDEFFKLYNKVNRNSDYDVYCGTMSLTVGSMIMVRKCVPGFVVFNSYDARSNTVSIGSYCPNMTRYSETNGDYYYQASCDISGFSSVIGAPVMPTGLLLLERRPAYARNVLQVVSGNPQLRQMADHLGGLYEEMEVTRKHYVKVRADSMPPPKERRSSRSHAGPRIM